MLGSPDQPSSAHRANDHLNDPAPRSPAAENPPINACRPPRTAQRAHSPMTIRKVSSAVLSPRIVTISDSSFPRLLRSRASLPGELRCHVNGTVFLANADVVEIHA